MRVPHASLNPVAACHVYFIRPVGMQGPVKIGASTLVETRRVVLEAWSPFPLEIAAQIEGPRALERQFHALFFHQHSHGEWFHWSPELEEVIAAIRAGIFPVALLPPPINLQWLLHRKPRKKWTEEQKAAVRERNRHWRERRAAAAAGRAGYA